MRTITSSRLVMRPWEPNDADFLLDLESRWETVRYLGPAQRQMADRAEALDSIARRRAVDHPIHGIWAIAHRGSGKLLGNLLLKPVALSSWRTEEAPVEIGWHVHPDAQGHGYATEAARAVMVDAAANGLGDVIAVTDPRNKPSQRVCSRLGMENCGLTDDYYEETAVVFRKDLSI